MSSRPLRGFTLLELVITLAVLAILVAVALPSFGDAVAESRLKGVERTLAAALRGARAEASVRRDRLVLCARGTDSTCGADWSRGWLVFVDGTGGTALDIDAGEPVLQVRSPLGAARMTLSLLHRAPWAGAALPSTALEVIPRGRTGTAFFLLCDRRGTDSARALLVSTAGAVRPYPVQRDGTTRTDPWNEPIVCPS